MIYGMYLSAGGVLTGMFRQDVLANNLANANTVGFKPDFVALRQRPTASAGATGYAEPRHPLESLGGGVLAAPTRISLQQGELVRTGNALDVAIRGEGFFVVNSGEGKGNERLRFTRDGRFTLNANGELVMAATGMQVLDDKDQRIRLEPGSAVSIDSAGRIHQDGQPVARLQVAAAPSVASLRKAGSNLFMLNNTAQVSRQVSPVLLEQGFVEQSAVDPIATLNELINTTRAIDANTRMMQYHDTLTDQVINRVGRVA